MRLPLSSSAPPRPPDHLAEVIETSTTEFLAQCFDPDGLSFPVMPEFGSWVISQDEESGNRIYGVVYHATTSPIDSVHRARALGLSLEELRQQQPQIFAMLKTEFRVAIMGFQAPNLAGEPTGPIFQYLPPRPPQVHQAVYRCPAEAVLAFTEQLDFLRALLSLTQAPVDSLVAAVVRQGYHLRKLDRDWLVQAGRTLSTLLKDDYDRLRLILSQIHA
ncbi:ATP synthase [Leptolyngbya sp. BL0902]|uniref:HAS-barrel domain-containing protein n=1 Tax=Leptolyngbya sp. BL0902 TaxID=1115757 RepID=UPI0018E73ED7|nr:HAS-barrel domain-containing protein [Leptolyngbya sp. BL0902]QQE63668.1 ATP synthase [Leptolyngbya sp. BL0902]